MRSDDDVFGVVGYGCRVVSHPDGSLVVEPENGVDNLVELADLGLTVRADRALRSVTPDVADPAVVDVMLGMLS